MNGGYKWEVVDSNNNTYIVTCAFDAARDGEGGKTVNVITAEDYKKLPQELQAIYSAVITKNGVITHYGADSSDLQDKEKEIEERKKAKDNFIRNFDSSRCYQPAYANFSNLFIVRNRTIFWKKSKKSLT